MGMDCEVWTRNFDGVLEKWWPTMWKVIRFILCVWVAVEIFLLVMTGD